MRFLPGAEARALLDYHMGPSGGGCTAAQKAELAAAATLDEYPAEGSEELIVWGTALNYSGVSARRFGSGTSGCPVPPQQLGAWRCRPAHGLCQGTHPWP